MRGETAYTRSDFDHGWRRRHLAEGQGGSLPGLRKGLVTYPEASHGWTNPSIGPAREFPSLASTRKCPFALISLHQGLQLLIDGQPRPFDVKAFEACIRDNLGYTMGFNEAVRRQSTDAAIGFLRRHLSQ
jgi:hypothetical protein